MISTMSPKPTLKKIVTTGVLPAIIWLLLWQGASLGVGQELLLPSPFVVGKTLSELWFDPLFWQQTYATLLRITLGILIGTLLGVVLAFLTWWWRPAHHLLSPALKTIQATPVVSFILLILLWLPRDLVPATVSALMVIPLLWSNTTKGLDQTSPQLIQFATAYHFSPLKRCKLLYLPTILPYFRSALSVGIGLGWKSGVAAEVLCQPPLAMGTQMSQSKIYLDTPALFAWTAVIIVISSLMERFFLRLLPKPHLQEVAP